MPKYWGKQIFTHGRFPEVGQKQKTEKKERKKEERLNDGNNNGQATLGARKPLRPKGTPNPICYRRKKIRIQNRPSKGPPALYRHKRDLQPIYVHCTVHMVLCINLIQNGPPKGSSALFPPSTIGTSNQNC